MRLNELRDVAMGEEQPAVYLIDDDASVREGIADLLRSVGHRVQSFESAQTFLDNTSPDAAGCIVLDVRLPGQAGSRFNAPSFRGRFASRSSSSPDMATFR